MIEFRALGAVDLRRRDGPELLSVLSQPKRIALLAYLLLARPRGFHRRDHLVALFWPEADAEHGRNSLRQSVYFLRRSLGDEVLPSRGEEELGVGSEVWCDARAFEEALDRGDAEAALKLYGGELLPGFFVEGAPEFERWLDAERARLHGRAARVASDLAQMREKAGDAAGAAELGAQALALAPDDEGLLRAQMRRLAQRGDRTAALAAYESFAQRLFQEYELEPDPQSRRLAEQIRGGQILAAGPVAPAAAAAPPQPPPAAPPQPSLVVPAPAGELRPLRRPGWHRALLAVAVLLAIGGVAVGGWLLRQGREPAANPRRVVVAAFENQTGDAALAPLSSMAADWITQGLTETGIVEVVDAPTALTAAREARQGTAVSGAAVVRLLSRETAAGLVVTGRYYRQADSLQLVAQVADARTGKVVRAVGPVTAPTAFPVQGAERLRQRLMAELAVLLDDRLARFQALELQPPSYEAYREYIDGLARYLVYDPTAVDHFERAFALDSTFYRALLWAAQSVWVAAGEDSLARYDSLLARVEGLRTRLTPAEQYQLDFHRALRAQDFRAAYKAARLRLEASTGSDDALRELVLSAVRVHHLREASELVARADLEHTLLSRSVEYWRTVTLIQHTRGDFEGELRTVDRWARRAPDSLVPDELRLEALAGLGRTEEVRSLASRMADRLGDAGNPVAPFELGARGLNAHGKPLEARALARDGLARCAGLAPVPAQLRPESTLSCVDLLGLVGRWRDADELLRGMNPPPYLRWAYLMYAGRAAARLGDRARALAFSDSLARLPVRTKQDLIMAPSVEYLRAVIAAALGDREDALRRLRLWRAAGDWGGITNLHAEPTFVPYLGDARFRRLLESED